MRHRRARTSELGQRGMGIMFSAFSWTYVAMQVPGGCFSTASAARSPITGR
jgi:hypothetical protein